MIVFVAVAVRLSWCKNATFAVAIGCKRGFQEQYRKYREREEIYKEGAVLSTHPLYISPFSRRNTETDLEPATLLQTRELKRFFLKFWFARKCLIITISYFPSSRALLFIFIYLLSHRQLIFVVSLIPSTVWENALAWTLWGRLLKFSFQHWFF